MIFDLHTKYDGTSADFEAHTDKVMAAQVKGQEYILDTQSAMKNLMTGKNGRRSSASRVL